MLFAGFDWDGGNREKCRKHGVSVLESEVLLGSDPAFAPDLKHSGREDRYIAVGRNSQGRPLFVAFSFRTRKGRRLIRPVTARYMHAKEIRRYEKESSQAEDR